jgi:predicted alpha/beta-fold hydrolase
VSSAAAFLVRGPPHSERHIRFREIIRIPLDGTHIGIEWELPAESSPTSTSRDEILNGPIRRPVVLVLHGLNNHADFGYVRSMMRTCATRGWVAAGMNLRGCGGVPLQTPRVYNGAYTGDIRYVVQSIVGRLNPSGTSCIFLVGNSLGANLITKYLGEEGLSGSLPKAVAGGVALGNPLVMGSGRISLLWSPLMALGAKKGLIENRHAWKKSNDSNLKKAMHKALTAVTLKEFDEALAPVFVRNQRHYPFDFSLGFENAEAYGNDAASFKVVRHVPVPLLTIAAKDDMIVYQPSRTRLSYCLANPNVMWVETMCGGHLGWQESPPDKGNWGPANRNANANANANANDTVEV